MLYWPATHEKVRAQGDLVNNRFKNLTTTLEKVATILGALATLVAAVKAGLEWIDEYRSKHQATEDSSESD